MHSDILAQKRLCRLYLWVASDSQHLSELYYQFKFQSHGYHFETNGDIFINSILRHHRQHMRSFTLSDFYLTEPTLARVVHSCPQLQTLDFLSSSTHLVPFSCGVWSILLTYGRMTLAQLLATCSNFTQSVFPYLGPLIMVSPETRCRIYYHKQYRIYYNKHWRRLAGFTFESSKEGQFVMVSGRYGAYSFTWLSTNV
jgi:hypothetical protein